MHAEPARSRSVLQPSPWRSRIQGRHLRYLGSGNWQVSLTGGGHRLLWLAQGDHGKHHNGLTNQYHSVQQKSPQEATHQPLRWPGKDEYHDPNNGSRRPSGNPSRVYIGSSWRSISVEVTGTGGTTTAVPFMRTVENLMTAYCPLVIPDERRYGQSPRRNSSSPSLH